jgi:hypothetical protein
MKKDSNRLQKAVKKPRKTKKQPQPAYNNPVENIVMYSEDFMANRVGFFKTSSHLELFLQDTIFGFLYYKYIQLFKGIKIYTSNL